MAELKTLKDFNYSQENIDYCLTCGSIHQEILRKEAIKWIKEFRNKQPFEIGVEYGFVEIPHIIVWIKHFFNITGGDL